MSFKDKLEYYSIYAGVFFLFSLMQFGGVIIIMWLLDMTEYFTADVGMFLDEFGVPFLIASIVVSLIFKLYTVAVDQ